LVFVNRSRSRRGKSCVFCVRFGFRFRSKLQELKASIFPSLFAIFLELSSYCFETDRPNSSVLKGVFNRTNRKRLLPYSRKIAKEALNVVFRLIRANRIHNIDLLVVFPFPKNTNIARLKQVGLVRGELNDSYLIIRSF
jgi:hypothetical protein